MEHDGRLSLPIARNPIPAALRSLPSLADGVCGGRHKGSGEDARMWHHEEETGHISDHPGKRGRRGHFGSLSPVLRQGSAPAIRFCYKILGRRAAVVR